MARKKTSKAGAIRETFEKLGHDARPKDVVATLAGRKIKVSSAQVSNIKARLNGKPKRKTRRGRKARNANGMIALSDLHAAKKLVDALGGIDKAQSAIDAYAKLQ